MLEARALGPAWLPASGDPLLRGDLVEADGGPVPVVAGDGGSAVRERWQEPAMPLSPGTVQATSAGEQLRERGIVVAVVEPVLRRVQPVEQHHGVRPLHRISLADRLSEPRSLARRSRGWTEPNDVRGGWRRPAIRAR